MGSGYSFGKGLQLQEQARGWKPEHHEQSLGCWYLDERVRRPKKCTSKHGELMMALQAGQSYQADRLYRCADGERGVGTAVDFADRLHRCDAVERDVGTGADLADQLYQWADGERRVGTAADSGETGAGLLTRTRMRTWSRASSKGIGIYNMAVGERSAGVGWWFRLRTLLRLRLRLALILGRKMLVRSLTLQIGRINGLTGSVGLVQLLTLERRGLVC